MNRKYLIVNADDFGLSQGVNRGVIEASERGVLTSASLMVRQPAAPEAAAYARQNRSLSLGLHLDLGEWVFRDGEWVPLYSVVDTQNPAEVAKEVLSQVDAFRALLGRDPDHLDSHQHVHRNEPVRSIVVDLARSISAPLRDCTAGIKYCGDFYGQGAEGEKLEDVLTCQGLARILSQLPDGITELGCHPGYGAGLATAYRDERTQEVAVLCAPEVRKLLRDLQIQLCSFADLAR